MLLVYDINKPEKNPLTLAQVFMNVQILEDGKFDNFTQLSVESDNDYSNFDEIRKFFMDHLEENDTIATYKIINTESSDQPFVYLTDGYVKNIGINTITTSPKVVIDYSSF